MASICCHFSSLPPTSEEAADASSLLEASGRLPASSLGLRPPSIQSSSNFVRRMEQAWVICQEKENVGGEKGVQFGQRDRRIRRTDKKCSSGSERHIKEDP